MHFLKNAGLAVLGTLAFSLPAQAADTRWQLALGGDAWWFDWREYRNGEELLVESGPLLLGRADIRVQSGAFYSSLALGWGGGKAQYDGQLQDGTPYQSDAWEEMLETELQLGLQQDWGNLHAGLMQRDWDRQIDGGGGVASVHEVYRWRLFTAGSEFRLGTTATALAVDVGVPVDSTQKVYSSTFGNFGLEPGKGYFWRLMLHWRQDAWELSPFLQQQTMDVSEPVRRRSSTGDLYNIMQPESSRFEAGLRLRYVFGGKPRALAP